MSRVLVIVVICLLWQALAFAGTSVVVATGTDELHELMHFERAGHHHESPSDAVHQDDSPESTQHSLADSGLFPSAMTSHPESVINPASVAAQIPVVPWIVGTELLGGLDRPPRIAA
jgi:hypothetical protein